MFVCTTCQEKVLSEEGKTWARMTGPSRGRCELCEDVGDCADVWSGANWAWKDTADED